MHKHDRRMCTSSVPAQVSSNILANNSEWLPQAKCNAVAPLEFRHKFASRTPCGDSSPGKLACWVGLCWCGCPSPSPSFLASSLFLCLPPHLASTLHTYVSPALSLCICSLSLAWRGLAPNPAGTRDARRPLAEYVLLPSPARTPARPAPRAPKLRHLKKQRPAWPWGEILRQARKREPVPGLYQLQTRAFARDFIRT